MAEAGWAGKKNGELLRLDKKEFDALVSTDKGMPHQQNLSRFDLAVVLAREGDAPRGCRIFEKTVR